MNTDARSIARSMTKSVGINRDPDLVFAYLVDPASWPQWAVVNVKSVAGPDGSAWRDMMTPHGQPSSAFALMPATESSITTGAILKRVGRCPPESSQTAGRGVYDDILSAGDLLGLLF
jgi:hypothetical protein